MRAGRLLRPEDATTTETSEHRPDWEGAMAKQKHDSGRKKMLKRERDRKEGRIRGGRKGSKGSKGGAGRRGKR